MFRAILIAAGLLLAIGTLSPADAARSRTRASTTEATAASGEAPRATNSRRHRSSASQQRRNRNEATTSRRSRGEASSRRRGSQQASARRSTPRTTETQ